MAGFHLSFIIFAEFYHNHSGHLKMKEIEPARKQVNQQKMTNGDRLEQNKAPLQPSKK